MASCTVVCYFLTSYSARDLLIELSDILHVTDEDVWDYGEALRAVAREKIYKHIKFSRLWDLLDHAPPRGNGDSDRTYYITHAPAIRRDLSLRYGDEDYNPIDAIENDPDTKTTYLGYKKFLAGDLAQEDWISSTSVKQQKARFAQIAKEMLVRGRMFAVVIKENMPDCVRLSIHPSQDKTKLSISLIPQPRGNIGYTPWHSCVAVELDGTYRTGHAAEFQDTHDLIYQGGSPHHFRARSELFDWGRLDVDFDFVYPRGVVIRAKRDPTEARRSCDGIITISKIRWRKIPWSKIDALSNVFPPVVLDFLPTTDYGTIMNISEDMGENLFWSSSAIKYVRNTPSCGCCRRTVSLYRGTAFETRRCRQLSAIIPGSTGEVKKV
jgi:hypothetical protein